MRIKLTAGVGVASLILAASAQAHVTLQPDSVPAGGFARLDVRVPNERDDAATDKVEVRMPDGFVFASYEPAPGWRVEVRNERLAEPIEEHGERITEQVSTVTWTATEPAAAIQPGQFRDFGLSVGLPASAREGDVLTFPALQTYDSGEVVRWIGAPDSEEPAAQVALTAPAEERESEPAGGAEEPSESSENGDDDNSNGLAVAALIVGGLGLLTGGASFAAARRR